MLNFLKSCSGAVAVYFALLAPTLVGFVALGTEVGLWFLKERKLQHAADAAVYATAQRSLTVSDFEELERVAIQAANLADIIHIIELGPGEDTFTVTLTHSVPRQFSRIFIRNEPFVIFNVRAVAKVFAELGDVVCMHALSREFDQPAISISGSGSVNVNNCAFAINSPASNSLKMQGANVRVTGSCLYTVGGVDVTAGLDLRDPNCSEAQVLSAPTPDPYRGLRLPSAADIMHLPQRDSNDISLRDEFLSDHPGLRVARFSSLTLQNNVTLESGLYIIDGGNLTISSNAVVNGKGVSFYLMNGARLITNGNPLLDLAALDPMNPETRTDNFAGFLFFSDRDGPSIEHTFSGSSSSNLNGIIYFPNDKLSYSGDSNSSSPCLQIVAKRINITGNGSLNIGCIPDLPDNKQNKLTTSVVRLIE